MRTSGRAIALAAAARVGTRAGSSQFNLGLGLGLGLSTERRVVFDPRDRSRYLREQEGNSQHAEQIQALMRLRAGALADLRRAEAAIETLTAEGPMLKSQRSGTASGQDEGESGRARERKRSMLP